MTEKPFKLMIVDDETDIIEFLTYSLLKDGYEVVSATDGLMALALLEKEKPSIIVLDIMMPGMNGIEVCKVIRNNPKFKDVLILFLTAQSDDFTQVDAFDAGGDDFLSKPLKPKILSSRIQALLRRIKSIEPNSHNEVISYGKLKIDIASRTVHINNEILDLPKKEFEILLLMARKPDRVFTREEIFNKIWGEDVIVGNRTIDVHIRKLREKIGDDVIYTLKGVGYKLVDN
jgi:two-component system, OmpR family, alkaline phosphatase synthesis response regulator PhoP